MQRWCDALASISFRDREAAQRSLSAHTDAAEKHLQAMSKSTSAEARRRAAIILTEPSPTPVGEDLRAIRAIQILERIGTPEARRLAETIAREATGRVADEAQATVRRMAKW